MDVYETEAGKKGYKFVCGVDEAGRGPLAGPVVAAAVVFGELPLGLGINDSKKLTHKRRVELASVIRKTARAFAIGVATPVEIDEMNILRASLKAMQRAIASIVSSGVAVDYVLVDGPYGIDGLEIEQRAIVSGDSKSISIAAASILAKTERDAMMLEYDALYPGYGFAGHKGYPTRAHVEALNALGATPIHRKSFALVRNVPERGGV